jgi:RsiG-like
MAPAEARRRIDRILAEGFADRPAELTLEDLRRRRDDCRAERDYLSLLRRTVHGRLDILGAEQERRRRGEPAAALVDRLPELLAEAGGGKESRGEALRMGSGPDELGIARRRVERLVADAAMSDPSSLGDEDLALAVGMLSREEREVSQARREVMEVHDRIQSELIRRFREDPSLASSP